MFELRPFERRNNHVAAYDPWDQMERAFFGDGSWGRGWKREISLPARRRGILLLAA